MRSKFLWELFILFFLMLELDRISGMKNPASTYSEVETGESILTIPKNNEAWILKNSTNKEMLFSNSRTSFDGKPKKKNRKTKAMDLDALLYRARRTKRDIETRKSFTEAISKIVHDAFTRTINKWITQINYLRELVGVRIIKITSSEDTKDLSQALNIFNITGITPLFLIAGGIKNNFTQSNGNETYLTMSFEEMLNDSEETLPSLNALVFEKGEITIENIDENDPEVKNALSQAIASIIRDVFTRALDKWVRTINSLRERVGVRIIKITSSDDTTKLADVLNIFNITGNTPLFLIAGGIKKNITQPSGSNQTYTTTTLEEMFQDQNSSSGTMKIAVARLVDEVTHEISKRSVFEDERYSTKLKLERKLRKHRQHYAPVKLDDILTGYSKPLAKIPMNHRRRLGYARGLIFDQSSRELSVEDSSLEDKANSTIIIIEPTTTTTTSSTASPDLFFHTVPNVAVESGDPVQSQGFGIFTSLNAREVVKSERKADSSNESSSSESDENEDVQPQPSNPGSPVDVISQNNDPSTLPSDAIVVQGVIDNNESLETTTTEETIVPSIAGTSFGDLSEQENSTTVVEVEEVLMTEKYSQDTSLDEEKESSIKSTRSESKLFPVEETQGEGRSKVDQKPGILATVVHDISANPQDFMENPISEDRPDLPTTPQEDQISFFETSSYYYNHSVPLPDSTSQNFDDPVKKAEYDKTMNYVLVSLKNVLEPEKVKVVEQDEMPDTTTAPIKEEVFNHPVYTDNLQPQPDLLPADPFKPSPVHVDPIPLGSLLEENSPTPINLPIIPPSPSTPLESYEQINPYVSKPTFTMVPISHRPTPVYTPHLLSSWLSQLQENPMQSLELHPIIHTGHKIIIKHPPHHTQDTMSSFIMEMKKSN